MQRAELGAARILGIDAQPTKPVVKASHLQHLSSGLLQVVGDLVGKATMPAKQRGFQNQRRKQLMIVACARCLPVSSVRNGRYGGVPLC